jgi:hypothetical protein
MFNSRDGFRNVPANAHLAPLCGCVGENADTVDSRRTEWRELNLSKRQPMELGGKCSENEAMAATSPFQVTLRYRDFTSTVTAFIRPWPTGGMIISLRRRARSGGNARRYGAR